MSEFKLAAGSIVKFGCTTTQLYPILRNGIAMSSVRQGLKIPLPQQRRAS
jgi:hypothetical protein